ncbi:MAG: hypothetical protein ACYC27_18735 [Armatimonadota bacterium]
MSTPVFIELIESRSQKFDLRGGQGKRVFIVQSDLLETYLPQITAPFLNRTALKCVGYTLSPVGGKSASGTCTHWRVDADYATVELDLPIVTYSSQAEVLDIGEGRVWTSDSAAVSQPLSATYINGTMTVEVTVSGSLNVAGTDALVSTLNNATWNGYSAGLVRFENWNARRQWSLDQDAYLYRVTYNFVIKQQNHNLAWRKDTGAWDSTTPLLYASGDFSALGLDGVI